LTGFGESRELLHPLQPRRYQTENQIVIGGEVITFRLVRFVVLVEIMTLSFVSGLLNRAPWI